MRVQPVVDHRRDQFPLARHDRLSLDHRRDLQHVVRRQVLRARVGEVDVPEVRLERVELLADELAGGRLAVEVVGRRKEEALQREPLRSEAGDPPRRRRGQVGLLGDLGTDVALAEGDLRDRPDACGHLDPGEAFREDDAELVQLDRCGRRHRARRAAAASAPRRTTRGSSRGDGRQRVRPRAPTPRTSARRDRS